MELLTIEGKTLKDQEDPLGTMTEDKVGIGESKEEQRATNEEHQEEVKGILSCVNAEDRIVVNDQYFRTDNHHRETTSNKIKIRLQDLLRVYADVFAWTTAHMMRVPKTIMIAGEAFNIEHRVNELNQ
ncbi:hypothetical protein Tco_1433233 [Tanacetum coccineum]